MTENQYELEVGNVRLRINAVLKEKGLTENSVAAGDSATQSRLNSQLSHGAAIALDSVLRVLNACPDVSADWLLRGTGENATVIGQQNVLAENFVRDMLAEKDKQIQTLLQIMAK